MPSKRLKKEAQLVAAEAKLAAKAELRAAKAVAKTINKEQRRESP